MSEEGQAQAIARRPPQGNGTGDPLSVIASVIGASGSTPELVVSSGIPACGCWVTFSPSVDCYIRFGELPGMAVATTNDFLMPANSTHDWWLSKAGRCNYFSVIRAVGDGVLKRYRSSQ